MLKADRTPYRIYCAGPLFNPSERAEMEMLAETLEQAGFATFVPHRDGFLYAAVVEDIAKAGYALDIAQWMARQAIFALDAYEVILGCDGLLANLNGRVPDEGAVAEAAMAWAAGKAVVLFKDDARACIDGMDNPLVAGLGAFRLVRSSDELPRAMRRALTEQPPPAVAREALPMAVQAALNRGERLAEARRSGDASQLTRTIIEVFDELQTLIGPPSGPRRAR
jgi:nucleoside 2-deoxyribosyltransferase